MSRPTIIAAALPTSYIYDMPRSSHMSWHHVPPDNTNTTTAILLLIIIRQYLVDACGSWRRSVLWRNIYWVPLVTSVCSTSSSHLELTYTVALPLASSTWCLGPNVLPAPSTGAMVLPCFCFLYPSYRYVSLQFFPHVCAVDVHACAMIFRYFEDVLCVCICVTYFENNKKNRI